MSVHSNALRVGLRATGIVAGRTATYRRSTTEVALENVVQGSSTFNVEDPYDGFQITVSSADFIFTADQLLTLDLPVKGDVIRTDYNETEEAYEVLPFGRDERVYSWVDRDKTYLRVHAKRID